MEHPLLKQNDFLFREDELLGVNKPAGVPVHGGRILTDQPETLLMMIRSHEGKSSIPLIAWTGPCPV
jgi:23S rRNA-/tRNA-specific pseudouridylate synthase